LLVGLGGLGCPAAWSLATSDVRFLLVDDDLVDETNLHRQVLFQDEDVGRAKLDAARDGLLRLGVAAERIELVHSRLLPDNALELCSRADVIIEGSDNYATKFLTADAARLAGRPVVHGAALGWQATAWAVSPTGAPCYRCLFEDVPTTETVNCSSAGVVGPVVGFTGALLADLCLRVLHGEAPYGVLLSYDGLRDRLRETTVPPRSDCALCGSGHAEQPPIVQLSEDRYLRPVCAA
jgi:adenylyltransferase/sulfurtransferase